MTGLGQFVKKTANTFNDVLKANENTDKPFIVLVNEYKTGLKTKHAPNGDGEGVSVDVLDLATNNVYCNVLWMGGAVRDQLKDYAGTGTPLPLKLVWAAPQGGGNNYIIPESLDGPQLDVAKAFWQNYPTYMSDQRRAKLVAWEAEQANQAAQAPQGQAAPQMATLAGPAPQAPAPAPAPQPQPQYAAPAPAPAPAPQPQAQPQYAAPAPAPAPAPQPQAPAPAPQPQPQYAAPAPVAPQPQAAPPAPQPGHLGDQDVDQLLNTL